MAVQDYELLLRVRADLLEAISGLKGLTTELGGAKVAADATGESADAASMRIKAMVQASLDQQKAMEGSTASTQRAAADSRRIVQSADEQAAAFRRTQQAAQAYRAAEAARSAAPSAAAAEAAAIAAQREEMAKLAAQIEPTTAALAKLDAQQARLNAMRKAGMVGLDDYNRFTAVIEKNRAAVGGASKAVHEFSLNNAMARRELGRLGADLANGNWGRFQQTLGTLANYSGLMSVAFSGTGLAIAAVVGSLGAFAIAAVKGAEDTDTFNKSLAITGNSAGVTAGELQAMAVTITRANGSVADSRVVLNTLVASGKVGAQSLQALGQAAVDMAALTGESADKAAASVLKMFDGTAKGALQANEQYNFLTTSIYDQIKALEDQGDTEQAQELAAQSFSAAAEQRQRDLQAQLSETASWWDKIKAKALGAWEAMKSDGDVAIALHLANQQQQIDDLQQRKAMATPDASGHVTRWQGVVNNVLGLGFGAKEQAQLDALQAQQKADQQKAADQGTQQQLNSAAVSADAGLDRLSASIDKTYAQKDKIKELNKYFNDLWAGADPNNAKLKGVQRIVGADGSASFSGGLYDQLLAGINKPAAGRAGPAARPVNDSAALAAQKDLIKLLGDEQGALDPVAKVWATYNDAVAKANDLAAKAKTAKGANVAAIDAERNALVKVYATARDTDLAKLADKDREAWDKLRDSLDTPVEARVDKAIDKIKELNDQLAKSLKLSAAELHDALSRIGEQSVSDAPKYQGIDGAVGGPLGELDKNADARKALEKWHAEALRENEKFRTADTKSEAAYAAGKAKIDAQYAEQSRNIDRSRQQLTLTAASDFFGNLAQLSHSHNRKMAAIGKAAAIAQAVINTYQSATEAYAAMASIPYVGPFLGAAAAAAAIAAGLANVSAIRSQSVGFSAGGYTGAGARDQPAGVVHRGEVVWSQDDIARAGGVSTVEAMRLGRRGYANGGYVETPWTSTAGFAQRRDESASVAAASAASARASTAPAVHNNFRFVSAFDANELAQKLLETPAGEKAVVNHVIANGSAIKQRIG